MSAWPHTRTVYTDDEGGTGPDYCDQCSERAQAWVRWPCAGTLLLTMSMLGGPSASAPSGASLLVEDPPDRQPYSTGWTAMSAPCEEP